MSTETPHGNHEHDNWEEQARTAHADDAWHIHSGEAPPQHEHGSKANPFGILLFSVASIVFVVALVIIVQMYFNQRVRALRIERQEHVDFTKSVVDQNQHAQQMMGDYGWLDAGAGVIRLPVDRAIEITAQEYAGQQ
ncbi:MAG: hypothetical protein H6813_00430 [Phycisphaeraceae bacterium]|nr:hypothetical protein [Phycisphaeraceae bacterium]MCB9847449.1 hypothetical protein [Phycisphaeraceae bacterium]